MKLLHTTLSSHEQPSLAKVTLESFHGFSFAHTFLCNLTAFLQQFSYDNSKSISFAKFSNFLQLSGKIFLRFIEFINANCFHIHFLILIFLLVSVREERIQTESEKSRKSHMAERKFRYQQTEK